ncbi:hypothetical protein [Asaia sp. HumB]|uniref:hypothetical protein n=1 Tax=Asaia sp. HumB TaxID=3035475 RepID=UPI002555CC57|nr:hypothetical protein [Asaia sp. HumB]MDL2172319.1 hypothetical protein [Asaia sp. HumB]
MLAKNIASYVTGWAVKRDTDAAPHLVNADDIAFLAELVAQQSGLAAEDAERNLQVVLEGWLLQRARGERPTRFNTGDFSAFIAFLPPAEPEPEPEPEPVDSSPAEEPVARVSTARKARHAPKVPSALSEAESSPKRAESSAKTRSKRLPREAPAHDLFAGLDFSRFHVENGV